MVSADYAKPILGSENEPTTTYEQTGKFEDGKVSIKQYTQTTATRNRLLGVILPISAEPEKDGFFVVMCYGSQNKIVLLGGTYVNEKIAQIVNMGIEFEDITVRKFQESHGSGFDKLVKFMPYAKKAFEDTAVENIKLARQKALAQAIENSEKKKKATDQNIREANSDFANFFDRISY